MRKTAKPFVAERLGPFPSEVGVDSHWKNASSAMIPLHSRIQELWAELRLPWPEPQSRNRTARAPKNTEATGSRRTPHRHHVTPIMQLSCCGQGRYKLGLSSSDITAPHSTVWPTAALSFAMCGNGWSIAANPHGSGSPRMVARVCICPTECLGRPLQHPLDRRWCPRPMRATLPRPL